MRQVGGGSFGRPENAESSPSSNADRSPRKGVGGNVLAYRAPIGYRRAPGRMLVRCTLTAGPSSGPLTGKALVVGSASATGLTRSAAYRSRDPANRRDRGSASAVAASPSVNHRRARKTLTNAALKVDRRERSPVMATLSCQPRGKRQWRIAAAARGSASKGARSLTAKRVQRSDPSRHTQSRRIVARKRRADSALTAGEVEGDAFPPGCSAQHRPWC